MAVVTPARRRALVRVLVLACVWLLPSACFLTMAWTMYAHFHIEPPGALSDAARTEVMGVLRQAFTSSDSPVPRPAHPQLQRATGAAEPVSVAVWYGGTIQGRVWGRGERLADAVKDAAERLRGEPRLARLPPAVRAQARIKVDMVRGRGPLATGHPLARALSLNPGLEGLGVTVRPSAAPSVGADTIELLLLPEELIAQRLLSRSTPLSFVPDFRIGLDVKRADTLLQKQAASATELSEDAYLGATREYFRFRTQSFIEAPLPGQPSGQATGRAAPLSLSRGLTLEQPAATPANLRDAAIAGGRYLVAHLAGNGRYIYERNLVTGRGSNPEPGGPYSIPRHAGTTYFLAELYRITGEAFLREPIERAFAHLSELIEAGGCSGIGGGGGLGAGAQAGRPFACVVDRGQRHAHLGSSALTVVALVEYRRATGDPRYDPMAARLAEWILAMQRPDGSFTHLYDPKTGAKLDNQVLYYSGEAALALARMYDVSRDERYLRAAERALDHLIGWYDEFFVGGFFFGEEHWTCIAAEAVYPFLDKRAYVDFCGDYATFLRDQQVQPGEFAEQSQYVGSYNVTSFIVPQNTPAGSRTEAMISTYLLQRAHGHPDPAVLDQIKAALDYTLGQQIREDNGYFVSPRAQGMGAVPASPVDRTVRIDYVQHACSALIRAADIVNPP